MEAPCRIRSAPRKSPPSSPAPAATQQLPKRALVTGGNGFVGRKIVEMLLDQGCEVTVFDIAQGQQDPRVKCLVGNLVSKVRWRMGRVGRLYACTCNDDDRLPWLGCSALPSTPMTGGRGQGGGGHGRGLPRGGSARLAPPAGTDACRAPLYSDNPRTHPSIGQLKDQQTRNPSIHPPLFC